ncbi:hypothetical protein RJ640_011012 [Escallonia rubra]|uniref:CRM domain-containing protein n=1 Tax=Escallonia rubra TaxID=112253 RepID=A0AA88RHV1_9ASTE|nr:hypothetical protein RJ640_011012 [Escallonia rubra]
MSATLFPSPLIPNAPLLPHTCSPTSLSKTSNFVPNPSPICSSKTPKPNFTTLASRPTTTTTIHSRSSSNGDLHSRSSSNSDRDYPSPSEPHSGAGSAIRAPTAPWMKGPLILEPNRILDPSKQNYKNNFSSVKEENPIQSLTERISGGRGKKAMKTIFKAVEKLQENQFLEDTQKKDLKKIELGFCLGEFEKSPKFGGKMPWERDEGVVFGRRVKKEKVASAAEVNLDGVLLERLRGEAAKMREWVKVKKAGVTEAVVDQIHSIWESNELAMLKFDLPLCRNMDRAHEIVEVKTGGLVVWRRKDVLVIYKGSNYLLGGKPVLQMPDNLGGGQEFSSLDNKSTDEDMVCIKDSEASVQINGSLYEREADRLLEGLGPRFVDWWRPKPLPVDADLLPEVVAEFTPPFRLCPPDARSKLADNELTYLRKLARPLPTHFVLGRNRKLQGLAAAILKLWEKCHIAKIAVKWGIPNTDNEQMADELKATYRIIYVVIVQSLTGGVLLLRNKFFIILYRGKDFLPCQVANLVAEREMELRRCQLQEEAARLKAVQRFSFTDDTSVVTSTVGTLSEFQNIQSERGDTGEDSWGVNVQFEAEKIKVEKERRYQERKLFILKMKIERTSKELAKLNSAWKPAEHDADHELMTQEERQCYRKIGLKMDSSLVLGRRGVFDGVVESLHQHWKHREVVKVITMQRVFSQIIYTARLLEAESGGILVSIDKLKEGHAIIIYRGKNYRRPLQLVPQNLLNKREALRRSLEMQRVGSLKFFAYQRQKAISDLNSKLVRI